MNFTLKIWRQRNRQAEGRLVTYTLRDIPAEASFLEMLDVLNQDLVTKGEEPVAFDHDCREGICGMCGMMINGKAHGGFPGTTVCQVHMLHFKDGDVIAVMGDSITEQHLYSNYLEMWTLSRFPTWKLEFHNVGIGGDRSPGGNGSPSPSVRSLAKPTNTAR